MTLSRFLRDYLYIALGGNRRGAGRRYVNLFLTMLLGGLWHGAGWTFVIWGALHGLYLIVNHAWQALTRGRVEGSIAARSAGRLLTFLAVVVGWVFFRAEDVPSALRILAAMMHGNWQLSPFMTDALGAADIARWLELIGIRPTPLMLLVAMELGLLAVVMGLPNTQQLMSREYAGLEPGPVVEPSRLRWGATASGRA